MDRGSDKHSPRLDDEMKHELSGLLGSGHQTHVEEFLQAEPSGEDQPEVGLRPEEGEDGEDLRARLTVYLPYKHFPMVRELVLETAEANEAPDAVLERLRAIPGGQEYADAHAVYDAVVGARS